MDLGEGTSTQAKSNRSCIQDGHTVLLRLRNGDYRSINVVKNSYVSIYAEFSDSDGSLRTVSLGKFGSFGSDELIGQPYGLSYEVLDKTLKILPPETMQEIGRYIPPSNYLSY
jgi:tRNA (adenine-N(1)-)-methyltransferase non-catalytic subunit